MSEENNTADALSFAEAHAVPDQLTIEHGGVSAPVLVIHNADGSVIVDAKPILDKFRTRPERRKGTVAVDDLDSFIQLVNRDRDADSMIFSGRDEKNHPYLVAVLDFHEAKFFFARDGADVHETEREDVASPRFCEDKVRYAFPLSDEWKTWTAIAGQSLEQARFAAFLEDHIFDIGEPGAAGNITQAFASKLSLALATPQALMTVSRGLEVRVGQRIKQTTNLENGDVSLVFETTEADAHGAPLKVPSAFHLMIPVFKNGPTYSIPVRLRRRAAGGSITWFFELHRADLFLDDAIKEAVERVELPVPEGTGFDVVLGTPPHGAS